MIYVICYETIVLPNLKHFLLGFFFARQHGKYLNVTTKERCAIQIDIMMMNEINILKLIKFCLINKQKCH